MTPLLSIITIVRNDGPGLIATFRSCENLLNRPDVEMVIVDGASTDDTLDRLNECAPKACDRVQVVSEPDKGIYDAMNKGLRLAAGGHVIFMNAGDRFMESFGIDSLTFDPTITYYGDARFESATSSFSKHYEITGQRSFLSHNTFCHQAIFYPRTLLLGVGGYDLSYRVSGDFDLTLKCFLSSTFQSLGETVCVCALGGFSHVNGWRSYQERMRSVRAHRGPLWWLLLRIYAPVFYLKHSAVKALDGSKFLSWYRSVRYG